jgi:hypothetical protein
MKEMRMFYYAKIIILFLMIGGSTSLYALEKEKRYDTESAMILYAIHGGGTLTEETNLTITGKGKLRFKDWGKVELFEEAVEEVTSGALSNIEHTQICKKLKHEKKLDVDFENKKILERPLPTGKQNSITEGFIQKGQEEILGYKCDIWEREDARQCLYKGIPLLIEYSALGLYYQKKAVRITFDINSSLNQCTIPSYPIQKFALFKTNMKTKNKKLPKTFSKRLIEISKALHKKLQENHILEKDITSKEKRMWLDKLGKNIFHKQKKLLPQFLFGMKKTRVCLQQASNWIDANSCLEDIEQIKAQLVKNKHNNIESWKGEEKQKILDTFDTNISLLESKMKCIRSAKNITDLSSCMK